MKIYTLKLYDRKTGNTEDVILYVEHLSKNYTFRLSVNSEIVFTSSDLFPFVALKGLRAKLEESNQILCCKGCRIDVYPSGRCFIGFNAYLLSLGEHAKFDNLVNILEVEEDYDLLSTIIEQSERYNDWLKSISV